MLGALSLILNGGGVAQLKTITQELNRALEGREDSARSVLRQLRVFMGELDDNKGEIIDAIEALNRLAISAEKQLPHHRRGPRRAPQRPGVDRPAARRPRRRCSRPSTASARWRST